MQSHETKQDQKCWSVNQIASCISIKLSRRKSVIKMSTKKSIPVTQISETEQNFVPLWFLITYKNMSRNLQYSSCSKAFSSLSVNLFFYILPAAVTLLISTGLMKRFVKMTYLNLLGFNNLFKSFYFMFLLIPQHCKHIEMRNSCNILTVQFYRAKKAILSVSFSCWFQMKYHKYTGTIISYCLFYVMYFLSIFL